MIGKFAVVILSMFFISLITHAPVQPKAPPASETLRLLIDGDPVMVELLSVELKNMAAATGRTISFADKDAKQYDRRILLTSGAAKRSESCSSTCTTSDASIPHTSSSCSVDITIYFVGAVVLTPEGKLQFTDAAEDGSWRDARKQLARKLMQSF